MKKTILIVDDEPDSLAVLQGFLQDKYHIITAETGAKTLETIHNESIDMMLLDIDLPDMSGIEVLQKLKESCCEISTLIVSGSGEIKTAVQAMQLGAYNYIEKPADYDELRIAVKKVLECNDMKMEINYLRSEVRQKGLKSERFIGESKSIIEIFEIVSKTSKTDANVLITGESGTGKELIAHAIHSNSNRSDKPFVVVSCPNLPTELIESELFGHEKGAFTGAVEQHIGKFAFANGGTIFLDEIAEIQPSVQARLLRVIQEREFNPVGGKKTVKVDVRIVAATNRELKDEIEKGNFREDLFFRLNVIPLTLPPLRQRRDDIPILVTHFVEHFRKELRCKASKFSPKSVEALQRYNWPGNIRELRNIIERVLSLYGDNEKILPEHLPLEIVKEDSATNLHPIELSEIKSLEETLLFIENDLITQALQQSNGKLSKTARLLGMDRWKLRYRVEKLKLDKTIEISP